MLFEERGNFLAFATAFYQNQQPKIQFVDSIFAIGAPMALFLGAALLLNVEARPFLAHQPAITPSISIVKQPGVSLSLLSAVYFFELSCSFQFVESPRMTPTPPKRQGGQMDRPTDLSALILSLVGFFFLPGAGKKMTSVPFSLCTQARAPIYHG